MNHKSKTDTADRRVEAVRQHFMRWNDDEILTLLHAIDTAPTLQEVAREQQAAD